MRWVFNTYLLFGDSHTTRQYYAIIKSIEPSVLSIPWVFMTIRSLCCKDQYMENAENTAMNKKKLDDDMRNEIVEYLLKGIRISFLYYSNSKSEVTPVLKQKTGFWNFIFGCFDKETHVETQNFLLEEYSPQKKMSQQYINYIKKEAKREEIFRLTMDSQKVEKDFIYGYRKINDSELGDKVRFVVLAPRIFKALRELQQISDDEIMSLFTISNWLQSLLEVKLQSGRGGAFFVLPLSGNYLIKSISQKEYKAMKTILADLYMHFRSYTTSYINPIYACYALYLSDGNEIEPQYFFLMKNVLDINKELLPDCSEILCFDIKGSTAGRKALNDPKILLENPIDEKTQKLQLKDQDFMLSFAKLYLEEMQSNRIYEQLKRDANFFAKYSLIDFSLLLFVVNIPYTSYISLRKEDSHKQSRENRRRSQYLELILSETAGGKLVLEERSRESNTIYRINNKEDIDLIKCFDDNFRISQLIEKCRKSAYERSKTPGFNISRAY